MTIIEAPISRVGDTRTDGAATVSLPRRLRTDRGDRRASTLDVPAARTPASTVSLPRRFDVHQIDAVVADVRGASSDRVVLDGSLVEMIDLAAVETLEQLAGETDLTFAATSVALLATLRFTGRDDLLDETYVTYEYDEAA